MFAGEQQYIFLRVWLLKACPCVNGKSYIHVHTKALTGLSRLKKREHEVEGDVVVVMVVVHGDGSGQWI